MKRDDKVISVFISPYAQEGILRVVEAQIDHLPKFGVQVTHNVNEADVICNHGADLNERAGVPSVNVNHGAYWSRQPWDAGFLEVNEKVVESMRHAVAWTVPSEWVNVAMRRGGYWYPETVYHGVDANNMVPQKTHGGYVIWNKARKDYISDPKDVESVAAYLPDRKFLSTMGRPSANLKIIGGLPFAEMKKVVSNADVYLATTRETFGIGTLEALAYGIPIAGFDWGGTSEIVIPGMTGYLAPPGDYAALAQCIEMCYAERDRLSRNSVEDARTRWTWEKRIEQYANIFKRVHALYNTGNRPKVSVIVTAYKLDEFLPMCLDSIATQTFEDFECLVVDDANLESTKKIVSEYAQRDKRFKYVLPPHNLGLPGARNLGLSHSSGAYIRHVDADDFLAENALELETAALDNDRSVDIVYGHLEVVRTDGSRVLQNGEPVRGGWPEKEFNWFRQMAHLNQLPSCVMARREVFERSGGYRERMSRNEDAEFWCRVTSLGFRAKKFTQAVTYFHRERRDSKGANEWAAEGKEPDWTAWLPWRMGADGYDQAVKVLNTRGEVPPLPYLVPFGAQGKAPRDMHFWNIHDFSYPVVSFVVTVGPGHRQYLIDALDSIQGQTFPDWECIVINDTGEKWPHDIPGAPWAKVVNLDGNQGASAARNEGYKHTKGKYIVWLDADDYLLPWFLEKTVGFAENNKGIIYSDIILSDSPKEFKLYQYPDFDIERVARNMVYPGTSILTPRFIVDAMIERFGGWDVEIPGMEDFCWQIGVHSLGYCAFRIPEPLFVYRRYTSTKREKDYEKIEQIREYLDRKFPAIRSGERKLCASQDIS